MVTSLQIQSIRRIQTVRSKESKYLTFAFFEKDEGMQLKVLGWRKLKPESDKPDYVRGTVSPWGLEIPVIDLSALYKKGATKMTSTTCIVIFEHFVTYKYYFGLMVGCLSNVINIAGGETKLSPLLLSVKRHLSSRPELSN